MTRVPEIWQCFAVFGCIVSSCVGALLCGTGCNSPSTSTTVIASGGTPRGGRQVSSDRIAIVMDREVQVWDISSLQSPVVRLRFPASTSSLGDVLPLCPGLVAWVSHAPGEEGIRIVDVKTGQTKALHLWLPKGAVEVLACSPSGRLLAWVEHANAMKVTFEERLKEKEVHLRVADTGLGEIIADITVPLVTPGYQRIDALAVSPDKRTIAFGSGTGASAVGAVDLSSRKVLWHIKKFGGVWRIAYSPDSASFFTTDDCGQLTRYETRTGKAIWVSEVMLPALTFWGEQARERLLAIDVSRDGKYVVTGTDYTSKAIIWDAASGKRIRSINVSKYPIESVLFFSWDGRGIWAAGTLDKQLRFFPLD